ncbi:PHP domain-containing protein [Anaerovorax odorimutans]|uniref:PHP domain-containing protein n=1 Tax=Anaerovorax odorimutans TaxID=109327 RepID=A0ABT1RPY9_9FIRM|nr:PHP domain-containing protein [Anaerovorax odorimutans]MCQ4637245.1 PHP domain-containing protein [Anaerovorax odorimutans]
MENKKYEMGYDLHTHTIFSHGKGTIEDNVRAALDRGLTHVAITDHGPGHLFYGIKRKDVPVMRKEIELLNKKYPRISIHLSVEANIIKTGNHLDIRPDEYDQYDFVIAGYHYGLPKGYCVSNWLWNHGLTLGEKQLKIKNTDMVIKALYENDISILTHPGDKGPFDMLPIAEACADTDTLMEISTWHPHMTVEEIKIAAETDAQFIISSDAHVPGRIGDFEGGLERAKEAGLDLCRIVNLREIK